MQAVKDQRDIEAATKLPPRNGKSCVWWGVLSASDNLKPKT
jgi:hypothetical protein